MIFQHSRSKIVSRSQHILSHTLSDFAYGSSSMPSVTNAQEAIDWITSVLYPNTKPSVLTPADLPTGLNTPNAGDVAPTINDYRIVDNDGTGTAAGYLYAKYDGDIAPLWHKIYSFNWGINQVLQGLVDQTQPLYAKKYGATDYDAATGLAITGTFSGQSIWGGDSTLQNLTLNATNFDNTGYVQFNDNVRPTINSSFNLGTTLERFLNIFTDSIVTGTTTLTGGTITDSSGIVDFVSDTITTLGLISSDTISVGTGGSVGLISIGSTITTAGGTTDFSSDNIITTGNITGGIGSLSSATIGDFSIGTGSFTSLSPTINIGSNNLSTSGIITANDGQFNTSSIGLISFSTNILTSISSININSTMLNVNSPLTVSGLSTFNDSLSIAATKTISFSTGLILNQTGIDGGGLNVSINGNIVPTIDVTNSLGSSSTRYLNLYLSGSIISGANQITLSELFRFNSTQFQDIAQTIPVNNGDSLVYDSLSGKWLPSSVVATDHLTIANINGGVNGDGGHSVFPKLLGRSGGQIINGGLLSGSTISIINNVADNIGLTISSLNFYPSSNGIVSLGTNVLRYKDLYMNGVADGLSLLDSATSANLDTYMNIGNAASNGKIGIFGGSLYMNSNGSKKLIGGRTSVFVIDLTVLTTVTLTVAAMGLTFANRAIFQLFDSITGEQINIKTITTPSSVTFTRDALIVPSNTFRVVTIEV